MLTLRSVRRFLSFDPDGRALLTRAWLALATTEIRMRMLGFKRISEMSPASKRVAVNTNDVQRAERYAQALEIASRHHIVRAQCLHRSLALHNWLRAEGLPSDLQIGVRTEHGMLKAHAWVLLGEQVVNDSAPSLVSFTPLTQGARNYSGLSRGTSARSGQQAVELNAGGVTWQ
jgi:hypothetical protein